MISLQADDQGAVSRMFMLLVLDILDFKPEPSRLVPFKLGPFKIYSWLVVTLLGLNAQGVSTMPLNSQQNVSFSFSNDSIDQSGRLLLHLLHRWILWPAPALLLSRDIDR
ncbi:hypothetical protein Btru_050866 [Bulinus truncatus]|nr:hypothetical protein Btru_050866 [Bulinus truncatus]